MTVNVHWPDARFDNFSNNAATQAIFEQAVFSDEFFDENSKDYKSANQSPYRVESIEMFLGEYSNSNNNNNNDIRYNSKSSNEYYNEASAGSESESESDSDESSASSSSSSSDDSSDEDSDDERKSSLPIPHSYKENKFQEKTHKNQNLLNPNNDNNHSKTETNEKNLINSKVTSNKFNKKENKVSNQVNKVSAERKKRSIEIIQEIPIPSQSHKKNEKNQTKEQRQTFDIKPRSKDLEVEKKHQNNNSNNNIHINNHIQNNSSHKQRMVQDDQKDLKHKESDSNNSNNNNNKQQFIEDQQTNETDVKFIKRRKIEGSSSSSSSSTATSFSSSASLSISNENFPPSSLPRFLENTKSNFISQLHAESLQVIGNNYNLHGSQHSIFINQSKKLSNGDNNPKVKLVPFSEFFTTTLLSERKRKSDQTPLIALHAAIYVEIVRSSCIEALKQFFHYLCADNKITVPRQLFQRFLFECKMREDREFKAFDEEEEEETAQEEDEYEILPKRDPILPQKGESSKELRRGLAEVCQKARMNTEETEKVIEDICAKLGVNSRLQIKKLREIVTKRVGDDTEGLEKTQLEVKLVDQSVVFNFEGTEHTLHYTHYQKFRSLYYKTRLCLKSSQLMKKKNNKSLQEQDLNIEKQIIDNQDYEEKIFHARLVAMLQRYLCLASSNPRSEGTGFHAALTEEVFFLLNDKINLSFECFASPFNCHFPRFCSIFEDTDCWFGSIGSFFNLDVEEGSFGFNPPFCEDIMEQGVLHIEYLLKKSSRPLSFFVILPHWVDPPTPAITLLRSERFKDFIREDVFQPAGLDQWVDGFHHNNRQRHFIAPWDGNFFFVQNEAAKKQWPVNSQLTNEIINSFRSRKRRRFSGSNFSNNNNNNNTNHYGDQHHHRHHYHHNNKFPNNYKR